MGDGRKAKGVGVDVTNAVKGQVTDVGMSEKKLASIYELVHDSQVR